MKRTGTMMLQVEQGDYESSVTSEKHDFEPNIILKTDKCGRPLLETADDLQNLMLLRKTRRQRPKPVLNRKLTEAPRVPYYVDEEDFFKACEEQQLHIIDKYLSLRGDVNARDSCDRTAVHRASFKGHAEVVSKLLQNGADITATDKLDSSCLHAACRGGNPAVLRMLLQRGADITAVDKLDSTPLHVSVRVGHQDCTELLIQSGACVNSQDKEGDSPLHDAVRLNRIQMIQLLLQHGADAGVTNMEDQTPLDLVPEWQLDIRAVLEQHTHRK